MTTKGHMGLALAVGGTGAALAGRARSINFARKSVAIFGGSRGLGLVIARELADEGARLSLVAAISKSSSVREQTSRNAARLS
jgi:hypothetical protein